MIFCDLLLGGSLEEDNRECIQNQLFLTERTFLLGHDQTVEFNDEMGLNTDGFQGAVTTD